MNFLVQGPNKKGIRILFWILLPSGALFKTEQSSTDLVRENSNWNDEDLIKKVKKFSLKWTLAIQAQFAARYFNLDQKF